MLAKGWYMLYPSFKDSSSFSTNYFEMGIHSQPDQENINYPDKIRRRGDRRFTVPLLEHMPEITIMHPIPFVDLQHQLVETEKDLYKYSEAVISLIKDCL